MIAEIGLLSLILALCLSAVLSVVPMAGSFNGNLRWMQMGRSLSYGIFGFVLFSFLCLIWSFVTDDFSVAYVSKQSNSLLPLQYKISAAWGGHEGSLLLWIQILACWMAAVAFKSHRLPVELSARVLSVMGMISVGFLLFILLTSSPFTRMLPFPPQAALILYCRGSKLLDCFDT